jgi:hypothetical protein
MKIALALGLKLEHINTSIERKRGRNRGEVIIRRCFIRDAFATSLTFMDDHPPLFSILVQCDRSHRGLARRKTITGPVTIDMQTVQTEWTMVAIASMLQRFHMFSTMYARKGFLSRNEGHGVRIIGGE